MLFQLATIKPLAVPSSNISTRIENWVENLKVLLDEPMNLKGIKRLADSRADIVIRYNFNKARYC